ncbi:hypothetical protein O3G_MSEX014020 [Manduca sexta]|uniref:Uncharacterized protein n=1 Tax=Manduca sexta TaxID=7130 RepID=A0A921ZUZ8_MANSE|nr:hypothetical protein O3G_MSEX014020 [Manduca sexta]
MLLSSLTDKKCYTLNIKQVSTASMDNPNKIVETRIQEINIEPKTTPNLLETINLLSDDEDEEVVQYFETEFGKFKIQSLPNGIFSSHQKKFKENCQVRLITMNKQIAKIDEKLETPKNQIYPETNKTKREIRRNAIPPKINNTVFQESEIIQIDDSSNESLVDIPTSKEVQNDKRESVDPLKALNLNCYVKLTNCDELVKKYETQKALKQKCYVDLVRIETNTLNYINLCSLGTSNEEHEIQFKPSSCSHEAANGRTSPVMEAYDLIAKSFNKTNGTGKIYQETKYQQQDTYMCKSLWLETKPILSQFTNINKYVAPRNGFKCVQLERTCFNEALPTISNQTFNPADLKTLLLKYFQNNPELNYTFPPFIPNIPKYNASRKTSHLLKRKLYTDEKIVLNKIPKLNTTLETMTKQDKFIEIGNDSEMQGSIIPTIPSGLKVINMNFAGSDSEVIMLTQYSQDVKMDTAPNNILHSTIVNEESNTKSEQENATELGVAPHKDQGNLNTIESNNNTLDDNILSEKLNVIQPNVDTLEKSNTVTKSLSDTEESTTMDVDSTSLTSIANANTDGSQTETLLPREELCNENVQPKDDKDPNVHDANSDDKIITGNNGIKMPEPISKNENAVLDIQSSKEGIDNVMVLNDLENNNTDRVQSQENYENIETVIPEYTQRILVSQTATVNVAKLETLTQTKLYEKPNDQPLLTTGQSNDDATSPKKYDYMVTANEHIKTSNSEFIMTSSESGRTTVKMYEVLETSQIDEVEDNKTSSVLSIQEENIEHDRSSHSNNSCSILADNSDDPTNISNTHIVTDSEFTSAHSESESAAETTELQQKENLQTIKEIEITKNRTCALSAEDGIIPENISTDSNNCDINIPKKLNKVEDSNLELTEIYSDCKITTMTMTNESEKNEIKTNNTKGHNDHESCQISTAETTDMEMTNDQTIVYEIIDTYPQDDETDAESLPDLETTDQNTIKENKINTIDTDNDSHVSTRDMQHCDNAVKESNKNNPEKPLEFLSIKADETHSDHEDIHTTREEARTINQNITDETKSDTAENQSNYHFEISVDVERCEDEENFNYDECISESPTNLNSKTIKRHSEFEKPEEFQHVNDVEANISTNQDYKDLVIPFTDVLRFKPVLQKGIDETFNTENTTVQKCQKITEHLNIPTAYQVSSKEQNIIENDYPLQHNLLKPEQKLRIIGDHDYVSDFPVISDCKQSIEKVKSIRDCLENNDSNIDVPKQKTNTSMVEDCDLHEDYNLLMPKHTYIKKRKSMRIVKRKKDMSDLKFNVKRYRKSHNIDSPKFYVSPEAKTTYCKEYKDLFKYNSSLKFSYSRPFHKENIEVHELLKNWPITNTTVIKNLPDNDGENLLFIDLNNTEKPNNIITQSLADELVCEDVVINNHLDEIKETNFNMGFGERSGRVIQNLEDREDVSEVSAATLSDVKQNQPVLQSENKDYFCHPQNTRENIKNDLIDGINLYYTSIKLKNKVKDFFNKSAIELNSMQDYGKCNKDCNDYDMTQFPFGLNFGDFINPPPVEMTVQVVQVGQLPVSAAAQNPVTCDPRVTQVSDASPPQCSAENSMHDDQLTNIKTEYTELTTADITLPMVHEYEYHDPSTHYEYQESSNIPIINENIPIQTEIKSVVKIELMEEEDKMEQHEMLEHNCDIHDQEVINNVDYSYEVNNTEMSPEPPPHMEMMYDSEKQSNGNEEFSPLPHQNGHPEKTDQIAHAMNAAGISTTAETMSNSDTTHVHEFNMLPQNVDGDGALANGNDSYPKSTAINAMALQQALAQILPPPLNQTNSTENNQQTSNAIPSQVLHIVQGKNTSNQITLVDNAQTSVINPPNATSVLHIVQNKNVANNGNTPANASPQTNTFSGLSLVDAALQKGGNQLLHIVNAGNQNNNNAGQLLKRVNLLTNLTHAQGGNEQKMVQFVCKSADGKPIQLNASHQRSMVLRLQPVETPPVQTNPPKPSENPELSPTHNIANANNDASQDIKPRSVYDDNYAKYMQGGSTPGSEKGTSLPKFNQAFGKQVYQEDKQNELNGNSHMPVNSDGENTECPSQDNPLNLDHMGQINSPPLLLRKSPSQTSQNQQPQPNIVQQIKETIAPMNIQTMHGGVIYTRQIPVNIGGGQTINLITVPTTELVDESGQKQQAEVKFVNQTGIEPSIIKIVPQTQPATNGETPQENNSHAGGSNENNNHNPQPQPVLTQMRIKLPMLSKAPNMVSGARVIRPSFFHIQRNVIGGANQQVYQQLVLTAAPQLGQQTIRLPQAQNSRPQKTPDNQSTNESQMSTSTLEQLREFDLVLEQVKERSTVQPNGIIPGAFSKINTTSTDTTDSAANATSTNTEATQHQVLYSIGNSQSLNVAYVNRKTPAPTPTTSTYVRSPDSSGIVDSSTSSSSSQASTSHAVTTEARTSDPPPQPKKSHKSKSRPKASSNPPNTLKLNTTPPKPSSQKPLEDEQTTQRILYILAEYKEQVENSPDKDKPAPRRRNNPPTTPSGSSKRKKGSGSRRHGPRDMSPIHGDETCRTMGSEDSSCGTSLGDCNDSCIDSHSPQDSPRKVVRKLTFDHEPHITHPRPQPQRNVIVADGQTITVARGTAGKPTTAVLMPANYILPVSMVKGGQQIAIVTNRGPKLLTVSSGGEGGTTNALLLQRLIGPAGLKPVLARPGFRHVRLPASALHNLQAFNLTTATTAQPPDSTASPAPAPTPPDLVETRATSSPWTDRELQEVKPERGSSPEGSEPWNLHAVDPHDYSYEETVRTENMDRTVLVSITSSYFSTELLAPSNLWYFE